MFTPHDIKELASRAFLNSKGYPIVYYPEMTSSDSKNNNVYMHRMVMENKLGRHIATEEVVHHRDGNRANYDPENLELMSPSEHSSHHGSDRQFITNCEYCDKEFTSKKGARFCSIQCANASRTGLKRNFDVKGPVDWPDDEALHDMLWADPASIISEKLGCSDSAISRRCKQRGIDKPPRGYWSKLKSSEMRH